MSMKVNDKKMDDIIYLQEIINNSLKEYKQKDKYDEEFVTLYKIHGHEVFNEYIHYLNLDISREIGKFHYYDIYILNFLCNPDKEKWPTYVNESTTNLLYSNNIIDEEQYDKYNHL
jgi:hypothetical protein